MSSDCRDTRTGARRPSAAVRVALPGLDREARDHDPYPPPGHRRSWRLPWPSSSAWRRRPPPAPPPPTRHRPGPGPAAAAAGCPPGRPVAGRPIQRPGLHPDQSGFEPGRTSPTPPRVCWPCRRPTSTFRWPGPRSTYLESNVDPYVTAGGADGPGQLALLILDAGGVGGEPQSFGGTDLVARLLATEQTSGPDAGLFGTEAQARRLLGRRLPTGPGPDRAGRRPG